MIELPVTLTSTGGAVSFASPVALGYTKNKGVYRLLVTAEGEWEGLTIRCFWHLPGGTDPASSLVQDGFVDVPASVTAQPGTGCITFEGSDGEKTVTSADLRYKVGSNSGTEDGTMPEPGAPAWEQLVSATKANADAAVQAKQDAETAAEEAENAATKAEEAASAAAKSAQKAEAAQKATEQAEAAAAESIAVAKKEALSAISAGEQGALGAVQQAQTTATGAVQAAQTAAESAVSTAKTNAVQEVEAAAKPAQAAAAKAEEAAERSTRAGIAASNAADDAAGSAVAAGNAASAAAGSESAAAKSAQAAMESKTAAATSEGNAAASAKKAQDVADSLPVDYVTAVNEIAALKTNKADKTELGTVQKQIGNLDDLTTKAKETLVAAINEAARTGAAMRTDGGYIQYSTDDGNTWENLIALAELKGEPGQNGADGAPGADGYSPTASVEQSTDGAKITITDKSGTTEAVVKNGQDGANGRDGVDGQPGKDGTDGITPTIGDNGNWFLGATDTGKPSRGATGDTGTDGKDAPQIDDTAITTTNPWSSKHIIDMLCPPLEESGNPVVCYPVSGYPLGAKAKWKPVQEGSGTPSPENIRPIKGRNSVKVERCGENVIEFLSTNDSSADIKIAVDAEKNITLNGTLAGKGNIEIGTCRLHWAAGKTYTMYVKKVGGSASLGSGDGITFAYSLFTPDYNHFLRGDTNSTSLDAYIASGAALVETELVFMLQCWRNGTAFNNYKFQIEVVLGTTAPTTYKPYISQTNTLTMPETVYGGEVDAVTGDGKRTWRIIDNYAGETIPREWISDRDVYSADKNPTIGAQVAYRLAEPVPFTATGAQPIPALAGVNTVLTDADSATVTGRADPIKRIEDLEAAVASIN